MAEEETQPQKQESSVITRPIILGDLVLANHSTQTTTGTSIYAGYLIATVGSESVLIPYFTAGPSSTTSFAIPGTATNDSAAAGNVGEYKESVVAAVNYPASGTYGDATSLSLTAGDWDVAALGLIARNGATVTAFEAGISITSGNSTTGLVAGSNYFPAILGPVVGVNAPVTIPSYRISLASTTTVYLKFEATYTVATPQFYGRLSARRPR